MNPDELLKKAKALSQQTITQGSIPFAGSSFDVKTPAISTTLDASQVGTTPALTVPPQPQDVNNYDALTASLVSTQQNQLETAKKETEPVKAEQSSLVQRLKDLIGQNQGRATEQASLEQTVNIQGQQKEVQELSNQLNQIANETTAQQLAVSEQPILGSIVSGQQARINRDNAIKALTISSALQAKQGNLALAQSQIQRSLDLKYKPIEDEINYKLKLLDLNRDSLSAAEKKQADAQTAILNTQKEQIATQKANTDSISKIYTEAAGNGAPNAVLSQIEASMAKGDTMTAIRLGAPYAQSAVDEAYKVAQTNKIKAETARINSEISQSGGSVYSGVDVNKLPSNAPSDIKNGEAITAIIRSNAKIGQGTKTNLANLLGVIASVKDMAKNTKDGEFIGISPLRNITDITIPFTDINLIPFRGAGKRQETIANESLINGINLRTQVWASGAALTAQQTKQVEQITPKVTDTDAQVKTKLNQLTNFMLSQAKSVLQSEGINFTPEKVDLFETKSLVEGASEEQLKELQNEGLI